jgi:hypothetical protein
MMIVSSLAKAVKLELLKNVSISQAVEEPGKIHILREKTSWLQVVTWYICTDWEGR